MSTIIIRDSADYERRMSAARARAEWELGDASWAGVLIGAFLHPDDDTAALQAEKNEDWAAADSPVAE